jgi:hypothetical protein
MNESPDARPDADLDALFALARARRPDTSKAEYAFETRLLARLRDKQNSDSIWAKVSWRLIPFFGACVVALTFWHAEIVTETNEAEQTCYVENTESLDSWSNLN